MRKPLIIDGEEYVRLDPWRNLALDMLDDMRFSNACDRGVGIFAIKQFEKRFARLDGDAAC